MKNKLTQSIFLGIAPGDNISQPLGNPSEAGPISGESKGDAVAKEPKKILTKNNDNDG